MTTTRKRQSVHSQLLPATAKAQPQTAEQPVSIREICNDRNRFTIYPSFQRQACWSRQQNQQFIDSILRGQSVASLTGYKEMRDGQYSWAIMDGQNRISAILGFKDGKFKTWTEAQKRLVEPKSKYGPVAPGRFFDELSPEERELFLSYVLHIAVTPEDDEFERATQFLRIQSQKALTPAERLNVYPSKAKYAAQRIEKHPFWENFYIGHDDRKQIFQSSMYLLALALVPDEYLDLKHFSPRVAAGEYDGWVTDDLVEKVLEHLDAMICLYAGLQFTDRLATVAMYQSVVLIEQAGHTIRVATDRGKLAGWIASVLMASKRASGLPTYRQPIHRLIFASHQEEFWRTHRTTVLRLVGIEEKQEAPIA